MKNSTPLAVMPGGLASGATPPHHIPGKEALPAGDYVSEGLSVIILDGLFPNMVIGNKAEHPWQYLRREVPHNWYCDRRYPDIGFLDRDEAILLYNLALPFRGKPGLEIGSWMGWSTCHLALAGLQLDVIDPAIAEPDNYESITNALRGAQVANSVRLFSNFSPEAVEQLAAVAHQKWSFFFIDGNHGAPAPAQDARICLQHAADDALFVFHDLSSPDVEEGLAVLRNAGFQTMVYQTMQIMAAAWRGQVKPVSHRADPSYDWPLPDHLVKYPIAGEVPTVTAYRLSRQLTFCESELKTRDDEIARLTAALSAATRTVDALAEDTKALQATRTELDRVRAQALFEAESITVPLRREVHQLWHSWSWRLFKPLRNFVRVQRGLSNEIEPTMQSGPEALQTLIALRQSVSWELTAPLRIIGRTIARARKARKRVP
jgi:predicted O-methyltransferase YrrM